MKKLLLSLILTACFSIVFAAPSVTISSVLVSDTLINSGDSGSISFIITNDGDVTLSSIVVTISSSLSLGTNRFVFNDVEKGETRYLVTSYSAPVSMRSGTYDININTLYSIGDSSYNNQAGAVVKVSGTKYLVVSDYTSSLLINDYTTFTLNVTNNGDDTLNNILLDLVMPNGFVPMTGSQFYISSLNPKESRLLTSQVFIERSIEPDSYQFTLEKTANDYSSTDILNIAVTGAPLLSFSGVNLDPEMPVAGALQTISVQFENIGSGKAYGVVAELILDQAVTGITNEYLGTLDRDDLTSAIFDIYTPQTSKLTGSVKVTYADASGESKIIMQPVDFDVISINGDSSALLIAGLVAAAVVSYFAYKRFKKKK